MAQPQISVIMSVYNGEAYLAEAIDSILTQSAPDFEFLIIDDASSDGTAAILSRYSDPRLRVVTNRENLGLTVNLNKGIALARAPLIARQDADDRAHPDRFRLQRDFLARHPNFAIVGTQYRLVFPDGRLRPAPATRTRLITSDGVRWQGILDSSFVHSSVMMRTDAVRALGGYNEAFRTNQDFELWSRLLRQHEGANLPQALVDFRVHAQSISSRYTANQIERVRAVTHANLVHQLGREAEWLDDWIWLNNPALWSSHAHSVRPMEAVRGLLALRDGFLENVTDPQAVQEIREHAARLVERIATNLAFCGDARAVACLRGLFSINPGLALLALPGLLMRWIRAKFR